jgi:N-acetylneuraminic acid mutarotase
VPQATTFSDPHTGAYQLTLPANMTHELVVEAQYPGYHQRTETVTLGGGDQSRDVSLVVDRAACTAPGYELVPQLAEGFDEPAPPPGWTVIDNLGNGQVWRFDNPGGRDNLTGGGGGFAIIDSQFHGPGGTQDTMLVTAPVDLSGITDPVLRFRQDFNWVGLVPNEFGRVDVSIDGGTTWGNLLHQDTGPGRGPEQLSQVVASAAGEADVRVRFHYGNAENERWWQVDDVVLGGCRAASGGLVAGHVLDQNTGAGVPTARIVTAHHEEPVLPVSTPDDPQRENGLFWFAAPAGTHPVTATASGYVSRTEQVTVSAGEVAELDFVLPAGELTVTPAGVETEVRRRGTATGTFTVSNTGSAPVEFTLAERGGALTAATSGSTVQATGPPAQADPEPATSWVELPPFPAHRVTGTAGAYVNGNLYAFGGQLHSVPSAAVFMLDPETQTWGRLGDMPGPARSVAARGIVDGKVYLVGGFGAMDNTTLIYDPVTDEWSTGAPLPGVARPGAGAAVLDGRLYLVGGCTSDFACGPESDAVHRYDPASDSWGSLAPYPEPTAFMACGGIDGSLYCAGGSRFNGTEFGGNFRDSHRYDPVTDSWHRVADLPVGMAIGIHEVVDGRLVVIGGSFSQSRAFAYNPATNGWSELSAPSTPAISGASGACGLFRIGGLSNRVERLPGFDNCHTDTDVPWLAVSPPTTTLQPGQTVTVTVQFNAPQQAPVTHHAAITITDDTPYTAPPIPVTMHVTR